METFKLQNGQGLQVEVINYGATLKSLKFPDRQGNPVDVVLGYDSPDGYVTDPVFMGRTVGRVANRIREGKFTLEDKEYQLDINKAPHHNHGGAGTIAKKIWRPHDVTSSSAAFSIEAVDDGYPGRLNIETTYTLNDRNQLVIEHTATTTEPSPINLTNHTYWNLDGEGSPDVYSHVLSLAADSYSKVDENSFPTGDILPVAETEFDFRQPKELGAAKKEDGLVHIDNDFVLNPSGNSSLALKLHSPKTGITLKAWTSYPVIHIYAGRFLNFNGKEGKHYGPNAGVAIEPQRYSGALNYPHFPPIILYPGEHYRNEIVYSFSSE